MARIRSIKPEFWTSAQILECSPNARLMFIGLWNFCDDLGRHPWNTKQVKAEVFPSDDFSDDEISKLLQELSANGLIVGYSFEDKNYFYVSGWKHQRIDKPQGAKYPDPFSDNSTIIPGTFPPDRIGKDRIGKDRKEVSCSTSLSESDWPSDFREKFWKQYPRRVGRRKALEVLERIKRKGDVTFAAIMAGVSRIPSNDPRFIPHPTTWLGRGGWDDEVLPNGVSHEPVKAADRAREFARQAREIEVAEGIGRPSDSLGGDQFSGEFAGPISELEERR